MTQNNIKIPFHHNHIFLPVSKLTSCKHLKRYNKKKYYISNNINYSMMNNILSMAKLIKMLELPFGLKSDNISYWDC